MPEAASQEIQNFMSTGGFDAAGLNGKESDMSDDLRVDVYMPLYVRDFLTSTFGWTAEERGHYLTLLMLAWDRGGLPAELEQLERLSPGVTRPGQCWHKFPVRGRPATTTQGLSSTGQMRNTQGKAGKRGKACCPRQGCVCWSKRRANAEQPHSKRYPSNTNTNTNFF